MTVRIPSTLWNIDNRKLAAILTPALLAPKANDAAPESNRVGTGWLRWGEAHGLGLDPQAN